MRQEERGSPYPARGDASLPPNSLLKTLFSGFSCILSPRELDPSKPGTKCCNSSCDIHGLFRRHSKTGYENPGGQGGNLWQCCQGGRISGNRTPGFLGPSGFRLHETSMAARGRCRRQNSAARQGRRAPADTSGSRRCALSGRTGGYPALRVSFQARAKRRSFPAFTIMEKHIIEAKH